MSSNGRASSRTRSFARRVSSGSWAFRTPKEIGGSELDSLAYAITVEELSRVSGSSRIIVSAHTSLGCNPVWMAGTDAEGAVPAADGLGPGHRRLWADGAWCRQSRGTRTRAGQDGDGWVLNGGKRFITNAGVAGTYIVTAVTDRDKEEPTDAAFIVEADTPGFSVGRMEEKMGLHASNTGELIFENCRVPAENMLGPEGRATSCS